MSDNLDRGVEELEESVFLEPDEPVLDSRDHYDPPAVPPKTSAAMKGNPALRHGNLVKRRMIPAVTSLLGLLLLGGLIAGAGVLGYRRLFA